MSIREYPIQQSDQETFIFKDSFDYSSFYLIVMSFHIMESILFSNVFISKSLNIVNNNNDIEFS